MTDTSEFDGRAAHARMIAAERDLDAAELKGQPSTVYAPRLSREGNQWCAIYGDNIQEGIVGFGKVPRPPTGISILHGEPS